MIFIFNYNRACSIYCTLLLCGVIGCIGFESCTSPI
nr:MAG TPA: hypothetical protein [Bacteriophage sp.]